MIAFVDVHYDDPCAIAACVLITGWQEETVEKEHVCTIARTAPYEPGKFYLRELPCIMDAVRPFRDRIECLVIDGYVWLNAENAPGLGAYIYRALDESIPVVGVAKSMFHGAENFAEKVYRGNSKTPLYITSAGMGIKEAAAHITAMHGPFRMPTIIKYTDRLCRDLA